MSASIKFTVGDTSQEFRITGLKGGISISRRSNISIREMWFSFGREPMRNKQDDYSSRNTYYTLYVGNVYQSFTPTLAQKLYEYSLDDQLNDLHGDGFYDLEADTDYDCWGKIPSRTQAHVPPF